MKNLLTTITLSALVGTSASNLKPVFTNNVVNHGFKSNQLNNKDIIITNENNNPFTPKKISNGFPSDVAVKSVLSISNWGIYVGNEKGLWKSSDGVTFTEIKGITNSVYKIQYFANRTMYVLTYLSKPGMNEYTIYKSTDGKTFTKLTGIPNNLAPCITFSSDGT